MLCTGSYLCGKKSKKPFGSEENDSEDDGTSYGFVAATAAAKTTTESPVKKSSIIRCGGSGIRREDDSSATPTNKKSFRRVSFRDDNIIPCGGTGSCRLRQFQPRSTQQRTPPHWSYPPSGGGAIRSIRCFDGTEIYDVLPKHPHPNVRRSVSFTHPSVICGHYLRKSPAAFTRPEETVVPGTRLPIVRPQAPPSEFPRGYLPSGTTSFAPSIRPPPPCYNVAVKRAATFSTSRGPNRFRSLLPPPPPVVQTSNNLKTNRELSSSTSNLYVDSVSLRRAHSRELSTASSTSSISEATVYKRVGPCNYVSVSEKSSARKSSYKPEWENVGNSSITTGQSAVKQNAPPVLDLENADKLRPLSADLNSPRTDSYRFSMANLEDTQDVDLDAILGELCALESQYKESTLSRHSGSDISTHRRTPSTSSPQSGSGVRTESPDNDSAFSDSVSLFSSESSTSSGTTPSTHNNQQICNGDSKAEKIRLALQKMKEANVKKLFVKIFSKDGNTKSLLVDESMKCGYVMRLLADKHHVAVSPRWGLVEHLPELHMERVYEEDEALVDNLMLWTRDSKNKLYFVERPERLLLFQRPEIFHPDFTPGSSLDDEIAQQSLVEEYLSNGGLPNVEGPLYIKVDARKGWKKYHSVLRASGLYYYKDKTSKSSKDLACLATFDVNQVYYGVNWKKKFKAPTEHCFAIKHPCLQQPKSTKYIKYLCAEDALTLHKWVTAIRMVKYGHQLLENYQSMLNVEDCELSDSGSSGCDVAFESDFPCGTIKRKPPKLPLTATTRQLAQLDTRTNPVMLERVPSFGSLPPPPPELLASSLTLNEEAADLPPPPPPPRLLPPPSETFLQDLQRVMRRKWQVAQKCKQDLSTTPHEVLGFRDPPDYRETNVSNWVAEHYGGQNLYENIYRHGSQPPQIPVVPKTVTTPLKKRPPPPPPPRAETTHLTTTKLQRS